jgi:sulfonate transport system substrate-binding protein
VKLVARKDHGINRISDMRHKRVGVVLGSGAEFSLDLELALQNIPTQEVQKVDLMPSDQVKAISKGDVDAVALWEPFVSQVSTNLGVNAVSLSFQSEHTCYWLLLCTADGIAKRSRAIRDFVSSMILAEEFTNSHTDEAERIAARKLGLSHVKSAKPATRFTVGLDHPLVLTMETEMRWMNPDIERKRAKIPDILSFIYFDAFNSVHAERIKILH